MLELFATKEMAAAVIGGIIASLVMLLGGFQLYLLSEKKRKRIEIFTRLAAIPIWTQNKDASELLSSIPMVFSDRSDDEVRIAYRNYHGSLNPYTTLARYWGNDEKFHELEVQIYSDQTILRRDLIRELAIASGWMKRWRAADFDFASLAISLVPQGQGSPNREVLPLQPAPAISSGENSSQSFATEESPVN